MSAIRKILHRTGGVYRCGDAPAQAARSSAATSSRLARKLGRLGADVGIQDIIEGKKQWRAHAARVKALPPDYQIVIGPDVAAFCDGLIGDSPTYADVYQESIARRK